MTLRVLLTIPHVFAHEQDLFLLTNSKQKSLKQSALHGATLGNIARLQRTLIHASLVKETCNNQRSNYNDGVDLTIELITPKEESLANTLPKHHSLYE